MEGIDVRAVDPREDPGVERVVRSAFGSEVEYALIEALRDDESWIYELSLGAYDGETLVGHVLFTEARAGSASSVLLAPLAVAPERQRQGVGGALVRAGLDIARRQGAVVALVLGHVEYYPRFGFEPAVPHGILAPYPVHPAEAWMAVELAPDAFELAPGTVTVGDALMDPALWRE